MMRFIVSVSALNMATATGLKMGGKGNLMGGHHHLNEAGHNINSIEEVGRVMEQHLPRDVSTIFRTWAEVFEAVHHHDCKVFHNKLDSIVDDFTAVFRVTVDLFTSLLINAQPGMKTMLNIGKKMVYDAIDRNIDSFLEDHSCEMHELIPDHIRQDAIPMLVRAARAMEHPNNCEDLKFAAKDIMAGSRSLLDAGIDSAVTSFAPGNAQVSMIANMGKTLILTQAEVKAATFVDNHACDYAYIAHSSYHDEF